MNTGDMVYFMYTDKYNKLTKYPAIILASSSDTLRIRIGKYDVHSKEISMLETDASEDSLQPRTVPCSYEDELSAE